MARPQAQPIVFNWGVELNERIAVQICAQLKAQCSIEFTFTKEYKGCTTFQTKPVSMGSDKYWALSKFNDGLKAGLLFIN